MYIPFRQLFGGYGWGVDGKDVGEYDNITIGTITTAVEKFEASDTLIESHYESTVRIGDLFKAKDGADIRLHNVQVTVSPANESSTVTGTYAPDITDWTQGTLTLRGTGEAIITITDYAYCLPTTITVTVKSIVTNGDFSGTSLYNWKGNSSYNNFFELGYIELVTLDDGNRVLEVTASETKRSTKYLRNMPLEKDTTYQLTFKIKGAPLDLYINGSYAKNTSGWKNLKQYDNWTTLTYTFTTKVNSENKFDKNFVIGFARGGNKSSGGQNTASMGTEPTFLDDIKIVKILK